jgi:hypothetical protein
MAELKYISSEGSKWLLGVVHDKVYTPFITHTKSSTHITDDERTKWNDTATSLASILGSDSNSVIDKWDEIVKFLDTYTEADTLANLLSNKVGTDRKITAGDGLTGGGTLASDIMLSVVKATTDKFGGFKAVSAPSTAFTVTGDYLGIILNTDGKAYVQHPSMSAGLEVSSTSGKVLTGITVSSLGHVSSVSSKTLGINDITSLSDSLDDKVSKEGTETITGTKTFANGIIAGNKKIYFGDTGYYLEVDSSGHLHYSGGGFYADGFVAGLGSSTVSGSAGGSVSRLDDWSKYDSSKSEYVLSAALGYGLYERIGTLEKNGLANVEFNGTGNVITGVESSGNKLVFTMGTAVVSSDLTSYATQAWVEGKKYVTTNTTDTTSTEELASTKLFIVGGKTQGSSNIHTYTNKNVYIDTDGYLVCAGGKVSVSGHTHAYSSLTGSTTTANQAIVSSGTANGWALKTLSSVAFNGASINSSGTVTIDGATLTPISTEDEILTICKTNKYFGLS